MVIFHAALLLPHLHKLELRRCQTNQEGKLALLHVNSSDWESHTKFGKELGELIFELPWSILSRLTPCYHFMGRVPITHCCSHHVYFPIAYFYLLQTNIFKRSISKQCPQALLPPPPSAAPAAPSAAASGPPAVHVAFTAPPINLFSWLQN